MAEYIDRDALIAEYDRVHKGTAGGARKLMVDAPACDVVEVVRCKDCMYFDTIKSIIDGRPMSVCNYGWYRQDVTDMHFCSHGHKKMDGKGDG
ncbi:MAG: hypothetical protein IKW46_07585 [Bacteroidaceae bacterium]|nr:hypothetical protein [Bacteroidaceae bacterium]